MLLTKYFLSVLCVCCMAISSYSQTNSSKNLAATDVFVGSTPCNTAVNSLLKIPSTDTCEFMKWELNMFKGNNQPGAFKLLISYGDYQPNTMNFLGGGKSISITGKLTTSYVTKENSKHTVYHLISDKQQPELLFIEIDNNILHLIDSNMKFIKGDASFGFVLNRLNTSSTN